MSGQPKPKPKLTPFHLEPDSGQGLAAYALIRAVYMDRLDEARAILEADPGQINTQDPFAGLTPLHIAIFRQNAEMVKLLAEHPRCDLRIGDNFQRTAADMLIYTADKAIFETIMRRADPEQERAWADEVSERRIASGNVVPLRPDD